jgi:hypothetical protein
VPSHFRFPGLGPSALNSTDSTLHPDRYGDDAVLKIELDGENAGVAPGLSLGADHVTVQGLVINRFAAVGIEAGNQDGDTIRGNFLGTDVTGTAAVGNGYGIAVGAGNQTFGGAGAGNLISGNGTGIAAAGDGSTIAGNFLGTDVTGTRPLLNAAGGDVDFQDGGNNNTIGGLDTNVPGAPLAGGGNVMASGVGLGYQLGTMSGNVVEGNYIGTGLTGTRAINPGGVFFGPGTTGNTIGGTTAAARNIIVGGINLDDINSNTASVANVVEGNYIGTDATDTQVIGNFLYGITMSLPVVLRPEASQDAEEARDHFEAQQAGLGQTFLDRLNETLARIGAMAHVSLLDPSGNFLGAWQTGPSTTDGNAGRG